MLLKLGELNKEKGYWPIINIEANEIWAQVDTRNTDSEKMKQFAQQLVDRNNKLEPSNIRKLCDEFADTVLGFMNKNHLSVSEAIALMETLQFAIMNKV